MGNSLQQQGFSLIATVIMLLLTSYLGASVVVMMGADAEAQVNDLSGLRALHIGNGGIQYALERLDFGESPDAAEKPFAAGDFTVATDPDDRVLTVEGRWGIARKIQQVVTDFSADVMEFDVSLAEWDGNSIHGLELAKLEHTRAVLAGMSVVWNTSVCVRDLECPIIDTAEADGTNKVIICHHPPGFPENANTISIGEPAVETHVNHHGDTIGPCDGQTAADADDQIVCEGFAAQVTSCADGGANIKVAKIVLNEVMIGNAANAYSGEYIDLEDYAFENDSAVIFDEITFSGNMPESSWYAITLYFADGSQMTQDFKFSL